MTEFYKISCIDKSKECNIIEPISEKLKFTGVINPISGALFSNDDIQSAMKVFDSKCLNKTTNKIKCPYCQRITSIKPNKIIQDTCKVLLTSGNRKGEYCGRTNCCYHKLNKENEYLCQSILKSGLRNGQVCGRNNCKIHNINL